MNGDYDRSSTASILPTGLQSFHINKGDELKKADSVDVYLTPDSKDSFSDYDGDTEWKQQDLKQLRYLIHYDLTFATIEERFPNQSLDTIRRKVYSTTNNKLDWTRGEVVLLAINLQRNTLVDRKQLPFRNNDEIELKEQNISSILQKLNIEHTSEWTQEDIANLVYQLEYDLTTSGLFEEFPTKDSNEISKVLKNIMPVAWTPIELFYLQRNKAEPLHDNMIDEIQAELLFRNLLEIEDIFKSLEPEPLNLDMNLLEYIASTGFYKDRIKLEFPGVPTRELVSLAGNYHLSGRRYTDTEDKIIKSCVDSNKSIEYIQTLLPLRTYNSVQLRIHKLTDKYRKSTFKNEMEELLYLSQWYCSDEFGSGKRRRRGELTSKISENPQQTQEAQNKEPDITLEEFERRKRQKIELEEKKKIREEKVKQEKIKRRLELASIPKTKKVNTVPNLKLAKELNEEAIYFQTVTGDRQLIKDNEKRKRQKTAFFVPQFEDRKILKKIMTRKSTKLPVKSKKISKSKAAKKSKPKVKEAKGKDKEYKKSEDESEDEGDAEDEEEVEEEEEEEEVEVSPYDPYDITVDTEFDAPHRTLFVDEIYRDTPSVPRISFDPETFEVDPIETDSTSIYESDTAAYKVVQNYQKSYKDLASSFPPLTAIDANNQVITNPKNKLRLRTLLYPEYSEMFLLAEPKHNELNSIYEMQKFFQIHYCLYFSPSQKLKSIIYSNYCEGIEQAVAENDFLKFMSIIDNWNMLMLILSPSDVDPNLFRKDINSEVREYLNNSSSDIPNKDTLMLDIFFDEISGVEAANISSSTLADNQPASDKNLDLRDFSSGCKTEEEGAKSIDTNSHDGMVQENGKNVEESTVTKGNDQELQDSIKQKSDIKNELEQKVNNLDLAKDKSLGRNPSESTTSITTDKNGESIPDKVYSIMGTNPEEFERVGLFERPLSYKDTFFKNLKQRKHISRFCMHQLLIRVYSRVVSTRSSKLRRYKAFTAEVYGELLPSFISEVLTKVNFQPDQKFYDLGSGVGNTSFQAALEFGATFSGGCELMPHASKLTEMQQRVLDKHLKIFGIRPLNMKFALAQSFVDNESVRTDILDCDVILVNNYLFDMKLNFEVGRLLYGLRPGTKIISLRNFITPRYKSTGDATVFDYLEVEKHEMSDFLSVSWTANKVPYYISTVRSVIQSQYLT